MRTEQPTKCFLPLQKVRRERRRKIDLNPTVIFYITDPSKALLLIWFSVFDCFGVSFCTVFSFCFYMIFS